MANNYQDFEVRRRLMVEEQIARRGITDPRLLSAMREVPRHLFVDQSLWPRAYDDNPLPIGHSQTISQPYMVALMSDALGLTGGEKVLEIGTGSGYQTAILAKLADWVISVERIPELTRQAQQVLEQLRIFNLNLYVSDGTMGRPQDGPYQGIMVTAGAPDVPSPLLDQLAEGGRLVVPVGDRFVQTLYRVTKKGDRFVREDLGGCRFVDLVGRYGWD